MKSPSFPDHLGLDVPILFLGVHRAYHTIRCSPLHDPRARNCLWKWCTMQLSKEATSRASEAHMCAPPQHRVAGLTRCANTHITHYKWNFLLGS